MRWNKILMLNLFFLASLSTACTRSVSNTSNVVINMPHGLSSAHMNSMAYYEPMTRNVSTQNTNSTGPQWNSALNPAPLTTQNFFTQTTPPPGNLINCYAIMIASSQSGMQSSSCTLSDGSNFLVGAFAGAIPAGAEISLSVPSGPAQQITIIGFHANGVACQSFAGPIDAANLSQPFLIGNVTQDLPAGTVSVNVPITLTSSSLTVSDCNGPAFNMQQGVNFGGAPNDGTANYTLASTSENIESLSGTNGSTLSSAHMRVTGYAVMPSSTTDTQLTVSGSGTLFQPGDEVMLIVMGSNGKMGPPEAANTVQYYGGCGYKGWSGSYQFAKVTASTVSSVTITQGTFLDNAWQDANGDGVMNTAADLTTANTYMSANAMADTAIPPASPFCYIQMVKVSHFYDLTIPTADSLHVQSFDYSTNAGGVIAIRVENNLTIGTNAQVIADFAGYPSGNNADGAGVQGMHNSTNMCNPMAWTHTGGGCAMTNGGGGGGGYGSQTMTTVTGSGMGGFYSGGTPGNGGNAVYDSCGDGSCFGSLEHAMFLGGAGGNGPSVPGNGNGGGIIYISARHVIASTGSLLSSNGNTGISASNAGGGGAGGSILLTYQDIQNPTLLSLNATGGAGVNFSALYSSGGGAGGRIHVNVCPVSSSTGINMSVGGGGTPGLGSATPGQTGSILQTTASCP